VSPLHADRPALAREVTQALVAVDVPQAGQDEVEAAGRYVEESIQEMPDTLRFGVRTAGVLCGGLLAVLGRGRFSRLPEARRRAAVSGLARLSLPVVGEYVRLSRGLGLVAVYEGRSTLALAEPTPSAPEVDG
jgi:hypothetical protein